MTKNEQISSKSYARWARSLIAQGRAVSFAKRYLQTLRRRKVLREGIDLAAAQAMRDNPLSQIKFTAPLSVAGCGSDVIVRAEKMLLDGIPVAIEKDEKGRHRGTPMDDVREAILKENGRPWKENVRPSELEVMEYYRRSMVAHPKMIHKHPEARYRKIPALLLQLDIDRVDLEETLRKVIVKEYDDRIFTANVDGLDLQFAICDLRLKNRDESVVIACDGKQFRVNKKQVRTLGSSGRGLATVRLSNLRSLINDGSVEIECRLSGWSGTVGGKRRTFKYYGSEND